jgi:D-3-phosphoglycerate dehydrogenase / 2-oxoglutarate reductase
MSDRAVVLIVDENIHPDGIDLLRTEFDVRHLPHTATVEELIAAAPECRAIFIRRGKQVGRSLMEAMPQLSIVVRHGVGYDSVDVAAATEHGIAVGITPVNAVSVTEHVFGMLLGLTRRIIDAQNSMRAGQWEPGDLVGRELAGKIMGIAGVGRVGSRVAGIAKAFGMRVVAWDPYVPDERFTKIGAEKMALEELQAVADVVTLHCDLTDETRNMIDAAALGRMKSTAILINAARGTIVDETALVKALNEGRLAGAAIDTFEDEPADPEHPLRKMDNVVMSPHVAGQAQEVLRNSSLAGAESITRELKGARPEHIVNPEAFNNR